MRRRIVLAIVAVAVLAEGLFALPLAVAVRYRESDRDRRELVQLGALAADRAVGGRFGAGRLARPLERDQQVGLYDLHGRRIDGEGPSGVEILALRATEDRVVATTVHGWRVVAVPLVDGGQVVGLVRTAEPLAAGASRVRALWLSMAALAAGTLILSGAAGFALARRLTRPLDRLGREAIRIGEGDFTVTPQRTGIPEIDRVGESVSRTAERVSSLFAREQAFTADASHQLRTPLTGLRLTLEGELSHPHLDRREAITQALVDVDRLETTIDSLLDLARDTAVPRAPVDLVALLDDLASRWRPSFAGLDRRLCVEPGDDVASPTVSIAALSHVLDVLVDNARQHGMGDVMVRTRSHDGAVTVAVSDQGNGVVDPVAVFQRRRPGASGTGIGLALARRLTEAEGGRLRVRSDERGATFEVTLPLQAPLSTEATYPGAR